MRANDSPLFLLALMTVACGPAPQSELPRPVGGKADSVHFDPASVLSGQFHLRLTSHTTFWDSEEEALVTTLTEVDGLAQPTAEGLQIKPCRVVLPEIGGYQPTLEDKTVRRLPSVLLPLSGAQGDGTEIIELQSPKVAMTLGVDLDDPLHDALPPDASDPRVVDQDDDGRPGITVKVSFFSIYLAARLHLRLDAGMLYPSRPGDGVDSDPQYERGFAEGELTLKLEQQIYDDTVPFFDVAKAAEEASLRFLPRQESHRFTLSPTDESGCADLVDSL